MQLSSIAPRALLLVALLAAGCSSTGPTKEEKARQVEIHTESCAAYLAMGQYAQAEDQALRGLGLAPKDYTLKLYLGRALLYQDQPGQLKRAEQVLASLPSHEDFRVKLSLGEARERMGLALQEAAAAVRTGEQYTEAADPDARAAALDRDALALLAKAQKDYEKAWELQPNDTEVLNGLMRVTALEGDFETSLQWGEAIVNITAADRSFWQQQLRRPDISPREEKRMRDNVRKLEDLELAVHLAASATLANKLDRPDRALEHLDSIIAFDPSIPETYSRKAQLLVKLGRYEEAIASIDAYMRLAGLDFDHPDIQRAWRIRSDCERALAARADA